MIHEVLGLDLAAYPFVPLRELANCSPPQCDDAREYTLGAWNAESRNINKRGSPGGDGDLYEQTQRALIAVDRAAKVFANHDFRIMYLTEILPQITQVAAAAGNYWSKNTHEDKARKDMVRLMSRWCAENGFPIEM